ADDVDESAARLGPHRVIAAVDVERDVEFLGHGLPHAGRHSGARAFAREPGIHNPRPVVMDSGFGLSGRPGMTVIEIRVIGKPTRFLQAPFGINFANFARTRASSSLLERASIGNESRRAHGLQASMTTRALRGSSWL